MKSLCLGILFILSASQVFASSFRFPLICATSGNGASASVQIDVASQNPGGPDYSASVRLTPTKVDPKFPFPAETTHFAHVGTTYNFDGNYQFWINTLNIPNRPRLMFVLSVNAKTVPVTALFVYRTDRQDVTELLLCRFQQ